MNVDNTVLHNAIVLLHLSKWTAVHRLRRWPTSLVTGALRRCHNGHAFIIPISMHCLTKIHHCSSQYFLDAAFKRFSTRQVTNFSGDWLAQLRRCHNGHAFTIPILRHRLTSSIALFSTFYRTQVSLGSDLWVLMSLTHSLSPRVFADLTDVTLADEDSNSIPTDDVNRASLGNVAMQVAPPGGQNWN